jgi:ABC-2 type transport system ATP-binding protein
MDAFESRYLEVVVPPDRVAAARAFRPLHERQILGRTILLIENGDRQQLAALGEVRKPSIAELFVAMMEAQGARP